MTRSIFFMVVLAALTWGSVWIADRPSQVSIDWLGYRIDTSVGFLFAAILTLSVLLAVIFRIWVVVRTSPRRIGRARRDWRRRRGYKALTQGMVAVAAGDAPEARRLANKAENLLADPPLTMLLSAQAAQLSGDEKAAGKFFEALSERRDTDAKYLGLHGQLGQAMQAGDKQSALELAEKAAGLKPKTDSVTTTLLELQIQNGNWAEAEETVRKMIRSKHLEPEPGRRQRAVLLYQQSLELEKEGRLGDALQTAQKANKMTPGFVPAAMRVARLLAGAGKRRKSVAVIEEAWVANPHPHLADVLGELCAGTGPNEHIAAIERLAGYNRDHVESHIAIAKAALAASMWNEAREHLETIAGDTPTARICRHMAELEESQNHDLEASRHWLVKASQGDPDEAWGCDHCGQVRAEWTAVCEKCGHFDSCRWHVPPRVTQISTLTLRGDDAEGPAQAGPDADFSAENKMEDAPTQEPDKEADKDHPN